MCGIAGIVGPGAEAAESLAVLDRMLAALVHRGPDDLGVVASQGIALGMRRLAVVDRAGGRQPVASADGRLVLVMNGEVYDHAAHRDRLEAAGRRFGSRGDAEALLALCEAHGEDAFGLVDGMFACALYDARARTLTLARDRMGEKPLVWFEAGGRLVFASEWGALREHPDAPRDPDPEALARYLLHRFVPAAWTAVRGVHRLPPGHRLTWREGRATVRRFAEVPVPAPRRAPPPQAPRLADAARLVRERLEEAVRSRLAAEVPTGVFLSGGVDSAAVAALARRAGCPVRTFTLRPADADFDEGEAARATVRAIPGDHYEVPVSAQDLEDGFAEAFDRIDEPIGDAAIVPTMLLARAARREVTVALTGEGSDELFGGYPTHTGLRVARAARWAPGFARRFLVRRARGPGGGHGNVGVGWLLARLFAEAGLPALERHLAWFGAFGPVEQVALWRPEARPEAVGIALLDFARAAVAPAAGTGDPLDPVLRYDLCLHLPDALLAKVDRATMRSSLEARAPFLARGVVDLAAALPARWKARGLRTKVVLRRALRDLVPEAALRRRKRGFAVPVSRLLAGRLGDRLADRVRGARIARDFLDPAPALALLAEHRAGAADHGRRLYALLALLEWGERWLGPPSPRPPVRQASARAHAWLGAAGPVAPPPRA